MTAIQFLTEVGKTCTDKRQEFILLSDTLGVSVLVITLNHPADQGSAESTVMGPFYWENAPDLPLGSNLAEGVKGEPTFYSGRVLSVDGQPLANALLDIWSGDGEGNYDMQIPGETGMKARGTDPHRCRRALLVPLHQTDLLSGSHRWAGWSHVAQDGAPSVSAWPHPHDRFGGGYAPVTTHLFVADSQYLDSDAVFGMKESLVAQFERHPRPDERMDTPFYTVNYDFRLRPAAGIAR